MRNKSVIIGSVVVVLLLVVILAALFLTGGGEVDNQDDSANLFGETLGDRPFGESDVDRPGFFGTSTLGTLGGEVPTLRLLSDEPVAGVGTFSKFVGEVYEPFVRFTLGENGHILETPLPRITPPTTTSLTTVPAVQEALWSTGASTTVLRYLDEDAALVYVWLGRLRPVAASGTVDVAPYELTGSFLTGEVITASFSPDGTSLFYLVEEPLGGSRGYVENLVSGSRTQVWQSPLRELAVHWGADDALVLYTRPSYTTKGYAWIVTPKDRNAEQVVHGAASLTASLNPQGTKLLYSTLEGKLPSLRILVRASGELTFIPLVTLPEKCVWSRTDPDVLYCAVPVKTPLAQEFPDSWYQGKAHFSDAFWKIDTVTDTTTLIAEPEKLVDAPLDAHTLVLSEDERYLLFRSRGDDRLWSLTLPTPPPADNPAGTSTTSTL